MTDEFNANELDPNKWWPKNPTWLGRQPAFFDPANVKVADNKLHLSMKKNEPPYIPKNKGYHTYTSAAVKSKGLVKYGYFEVRCKPMASAGSSSFWFYHSTPNLWTEIDVFEIGGRAPGFEKKYNMNVHVFKTPTEKKHWSKHGVWIAPENLADDYHVYALEWNVERIKWYFDGVLIRWVENSHWHQPLTLNFDSETMPNWFGLPKDADLPSTYSIEYVRAWKTRDQILSSGRLILEMFRAKGKNAATPDQISQYKRIFDGIDRDSDKKISQLGNKEAKAWKRFRWLKEQGHTDSIEFPTIRFAPGDEGFTGWRKFYWPRKRGGTDGIAAIAGIVARWGPYDVSGKAMKGDFGLDTATRWKMIKERLVHTGHIFSVKNPPLVQESAALPLVAL